MNRRYFLVILDSTGRLVRRVAVGRRLLQILAAAFCLGILAVVSIAAHGLWHRAAALEAESLMRENEMLRQVAVQLESRLPQQRLTALHGELTFAQLWAKTGLGSTPRMLGVGPLEHDDGLSDLATEAATILHQDESQILSVDLAALPLEFDRLDDDGKRLQSFLGEMTEYFNDAKLLLSNTPSVKPVSGYMTSSFGKRRDPMHGAMVMHKGLDIGGQVGMEIFAPADGVVIFTGQRGGYGNTVVIDHGYGLQTHYAHLSKFKTKTGERIRRGDLIANMGTSGRSTGPHLHYEVRRFGQPLNPSHFILN